MAMAKEKELQYHFFSQRELHKYLENFYRRKTKKKCTLYLSSAETSQIEMKKTVNNIHISIHNLLDFYKKAPKYYQKLLYTVIVHEFAHAVYTGTHLPYTEVFNVIEDMRIEYQTEKWNKKARFDVMRYLLQDKNLNLNDLNSKTNLALALFRTINNKPYVDYLESLGIDLTRLFDLAKKYKQTNYELGTKEMLTDEHIKLQNLGDDIDDELNKIIKDKEKKEKEQPKKQKQKFGSKENQQTKKLEDKLFSFQDTPDLTTLVDKRLKNPKTTSYKPPFYKTEIADTIRRSGIKGRGDRKTRSGSIKTFNAKSYMRRKHTMERKHFDTIDYTRRGGKSTKLTVYLDISASMRARVGNGKTRLKIAVDYLANLYDQSHKNIDITLKAFGTTMKRITRNELDPRFLTQNLDDTTLLFPDRIKKDELAIVITDGKFANAEAIPNEFLRKAHLIVIDRVSTNVYARNKYFISTEELNKTMDNVTKKLKEAFKNAR